MLNNVIKTPGRAVPVAKPKRRPVDVDAGFKKAMKRYPKIIARLAE